MPPKKRSCKLRKVRKKSDEIHNLKCEKKYMFIDNPWMKDVLKQKNPTGYNKELKKMIKARIAYINSKLRAISN